MLHTSPISHTSSLIYDLPFIHPLIPLRPRRHHTYTAMQQYDRPILPISYPPPVILPISYLSSSVYDLSFIHISPRHIPIYPSYHIPLCDTYHHPPPPPSSSYSLRYTAMRHDGRYPDTPQHIPPMYHSEESSMSSSYTHSDPGDTSMLHTSHTISSPPFYDIISPHLRPISSLPSPPTYYSEKFPHMYFLIFLYTIYQPTMYTYIHQSSLLHIRLMLYCNTPPTLPHIISSYTSSEKSPIYVFSKIPPPIDGKLPQYLF